VTRAYDLEVAADAPQGWWRLVEPTGATAVRAQVGPSLAINGSPGRVSSPFGLAYSFPGVDESTNMTATLTHTITTQGALECWVQRDVATGGGFVKLGAASATAGVGVGIGSNTFDVNGNDLIGLYELVEWRDTNTVVPTGRWNHVALEWNGNVTTFFLNGAQVASMGTNAPRAPDGAVFVGGYSNRFGAYSLAQVALYGTLPGLARWQAHYAAGLRAGAIY
jgi:hypothetical protein